MLERSGLAEKRADVRALLESSRALLRVEGGGRPPPSPRRLLGKLLALVGLLIDIAAMAGFCAGLAGWLGETLPPPLALGLLLAGPAWALLRAPALRAALVEAALIALYHARWGWDWFAEAFSSAAQRRLEARLAAREVMWLWRRHRSALPRRPSLADVEEFLHGTYGHAARDAFAAALAQAGRQGGGPRLAALRWLALIMAFEAVAAAGGLKPPPAARPAPTPPSLGPFAPGHEQAATVQHDTPERIQRRADLRELIRRKRQDVTTAYGWKLKTPAEIAQREMHVDELKADIAALEAELTAIDA